MHAVNVNLKIDYFYLNLRNVVNISPTKRPTIHQQKVFFMPVRLTPSDLLEHQ